MNEKLCYININLRVRYWDEMFVHFKSLNINLGVHQNINWLLSLNGLHSILRRTLRKLDFFPPKDWYFQNQ